ncbi:MAG TPA: hypothetical protein DCO80_08245 [Ornithinibacillus sp.]|nr:hypothetical protein [Ornithinibacillus sp.]
MKSMARYPEDATFKGRNSPHLEMRNIHPSSETVPRKMKECSHRQGLCVQKRKVYTRPSSIKVARTIAIQQNYPLQKQGAP